MELINAISAIDYLAKYKELIASENVLILKIFININKCVREKSDKFEYLYIMLNIYFPKNFFLVVCYSQCLKIIIYIRHLSKNNRVKTMK